jgi:hypothetical protein
LVQLILLIVHRHARFHGYPAFPQGTFRSELTLSRSVSASLQSGHKKPVWLAPDGFHSRQRFGH